VARVGALVLVVLGHLTLAVIDRGPDGAIRGSNLLSLHPGWVWLAMLAPMPVFFAAAGWANATADAASAAGRQASYSFYYAGPDVNTAAKGPYLSSDQALKILFDWFNANGGTSRATRKPHRAEGLNGPR